MNARPTLLAFFCCVAAAGLLLSGRASSKELTGAANQAARVPEKVGSWVGKPLALGQRTYDLLETNDVVVMEYSTAQSESPVWLSQVAGLDNRSAFHPPELCYVGSHYEIAERGRITVPIHGQDRELMRLLVRKEQEVHETWYWFTANKRMTANYYKQQLWLILDAIRRRPIEGTLVRVSTPFTGSAESVHARLLDFVDSLTETSYEL